MSSKTNNTNNNRLDLDYFENILILNALSNPDYLSSIVSHLDISYFNDKNIGRVLSKAVEFFNERGTVPSITEIKARLTSEEDKKAIAEVKKKLSEMEATFNNDELIANTEKFLKERFVYKTVLNIAEKFSEQSFKLEEVLVDFEKAYNITLRENLGHWYLEDVDKHIKDLIAIHKPIPTGWKFFDERTEGGLFPKTLTVFAGQVNVGKSIVLGNIATNMLLNDKNVLLISLEMSEFMYSKRISTQLTQIPHGDLKTYTKELADQVNHLKKKLNSRLVIKEYPPKSITVRHIDSFITKLKHKGFSPDIIVIDYINLLHPVGKNLNSYESVKEIAEHLRALSFKYNIPIVSATQLTRCLHVDTDIAMEDGTTKKLSDIKVGDTLKGKNNSVQVRYVYPIERKQCVKIKTKSGKEIICSKDHLFPTTNGVKSIETGLNIGDSFFTATHQKNE